jgi:hypothetical protein
VQDQSFLPGCVLMDASSDDQVVFELLCRLGDRVDKNIVRHAKPFRSAADPQSAAKLRLIRQMNGTLDQLEAMAAPLVEDTRAPTA